MENEDKDSHIDPRALGGENSLPIDEIATLATGEDCVDYKRIGSTIADQQSVNQSVIQENTKINAEQFDFGLAPDGWLTRTTVSKLGDGATDTYARIAEGYREDHPEWFQMHKTVRSGYREHYSPALQRAILEDYKQFKSAPDGWMTIKAISSELGMGSATIQGYMQQIEEEDASLVRTYLANNHPRRHMSPKIMELLRDRLKDIIDAPEGWTTNGALATKFGVSSATVQKAAQNYLEKDGFTQQLKSKTGNIRTYYSPELTAILTEQFETTTPAPEGWINMPQLRSELNRDGSTLKKRIEILKKDHPEWIGQFDKKGKKIEYYAPELVQSIANILVPLPPADWVNPGALARELNKDWGTIKKIVEEERLVHPENIAVFAGKGKTVTEYLAPDLVGRIRERFLLFSEPPEGWANCTALAEVLGVPKQTIKKYAYQFGEESGLLVSYAHKGKVSVHCSPELIETLGNFFSTRIAPSEGWMPINTIAEGAGVSRTVIERLSEQYEDEFPEWFQDYQTQSGHLAKHFSPELVDIITSKLNSDIHQKLARERAIRERQELKNEIRELLADVGEGETLEAQEFKEYVQLFGAERIIDIFYRFMPGAKGKVEVPYIASMLSNYLGDTLVVRGEFSPDALEKGIGLLSDESFKSSLGEVIKKQCLELLNKLGKEDLEAVNVNSVLNYLNHVRAKTAYFTTDDFEDVLGEVEAYYHLLFENVHKPERFVDTLNEGRLFPDIYQRINVQEIAFKRKLLIADEMGTGKSASVIMAKEILGVKQALIIAPSNVVEVWQNYLVDYFKEGQAPKVLIVKSPEDLIGISQDDYQYVIISQERLSEEYMEGLSNLNYDMLIADEMHKLKNVREGKRSECFMKLADRIQDDNQYLVMLSGTPVPNKIEDIAITLRVLYPERFKDIENKEIVSQILNGDMLDIRSLLVPRMQMKLLAETVEMPKLTEQSHYIAMSPQLQEAYAIIVDDDELSANAKIKAMRKLLMNPELLEATPNFENSKLEAVKASLRQTFATKDKSVMFVNGYITDVIRGDKSIVSELGLPNDVEVLVIHGGVKGDERRQIQDALQNSDKRILLVVSGQTADVGVDFSGAQEVYFYNEPWTEYDRRQQLSRVYRPGLKDDLKVHTFIMEGTIEEGIHRYIQSKFQAIEKLLRGIPLAEVERELLRYSERQVDPKLEVNKDLAEYYFSSWDKMMNIYKHVKNIGEKDFMEFLKTWGIEYADCYANLVGSRSYQANVGRLSGTMIDSFAKEKGQKPEELVILDVASGPEMLKQHVDEAYASRVISLDVNRHHFKEANGKQVASSFVKLPVADESVDYANLSLSIHYSGYLPPKPKRGEPDHMPELKYERIEVLRELNRVLREGGRAVMPMIYSLKFMDDPNFREAIDKLGFRVIDEYTGNAVSDRNFKTQVITLEKTKIIEETTPEIAGSMTPHIQRALKFGKVATRLRDSRKIVTNFLIRDVSIETKLNTIDQVALLEEQEILSNMESLKLSYVRIKDIPKEEIIKHKYSRIFYDKRYVLFKQLETGSGAVILR